MKQPKIVLAYQAYPMSIGLYFKRAFRRLGLEVTHIGNTTYDSIPWVHPSVSKPISGMAPDIPDIKLSQRKGRYEPNEWIPLVEDCDLFINVDAGHHFAGRGKFKKIIVGTDPHAIPGYPGRREDCDHFCVMQKNYGSPGDFWLPYAYDSRAHYRTDLPFSQRPIDIIFVGNAYGNRIIDLHRLTKSFVVDQQLGPILEEYTILHHNAKAAYATPSMNDLPARFFEAMAVGCAPISRIVPDMKDLGAYPGVHFIDATTPELMMAGSEDILRSEDNWVMMLAECDEWVRPHTWERRVLQMLQLTGFVPGDPTDMRAKPAWHNPW